LDDAFAEAGAELVDARSAFNAEIVLKVQSPTLAELPLLHPGAVLVGMLEPFNTANATALASSGITAFSLEAAPRTTRAQSLDVLSSQANLAGYKAVLIAANLYPRLIPMMMTAAGTIKAARVLVLGAGVAGLQAIATARRLGGVIEASDVRPAVKEQIESLGAKFLDVPYETDEERDAAHGIGGYARPMPASWLNRQAALVHERAVQADIVITTALIPGRDAPTLLAAETVRAMKPGSVVVDLAAGRGPIAVETSGRRGGNCPLTEADQIIKRHGVWIVGHTNIPALVAADASALYARNVFDFLKLIVTKEGLLNIDLADDIVAATLLTRDGELARKG
jgi:NAD(P) transhydrogenase subunit alpha